jgi:hypothetical protein
MCNKILQNVRNKNDTLSSDQQRQLGLEVHHFGDFIYNQRVGQFGDWIPVGVRFSAPVQIGPPAHPASYTIGSGSLSPWLKQRDMALTIRPI